MVVLVYCSEYHTRNCGCCTGIRISEMNGSESNASRVFASTDVELGTLEEDRDLTTRLLDCDSVSLPILAENFETRESLFDCIVRNSSSRVLLKLTGNYWPQTGVMTWSNCGHKFVFILNRTLLIGLFCIIVYDFAAGVGQKLPDQVIFDVIIAVDILSLLPAQYFNQRRLQQKSRIQDSLVLDASASVAVRFGIVYLLTLALIIALALVMLVRRGEGTLMSHVGDIAVTLGQFSLSAYLTFNLLLLLMDLNVSAVLIDQLSILADKKLLTLDKFHFVRQEISRRVTESRWVTDIIIFPCVVSVIGLILIMYFVNSIDPLIAVAWVFVLIKELLFVSVVFWFVTQVNGRADTLTEKLSAARWSSSKGKGDSVNTDLELERLSLCSSAVVKPIAFSLMFRRLNWNNVAYSAAGLSLSLVAMFIKSLVGL